MGVLKGKELETSLYAVATGLNAFFLWKAFHLKFMVRGILGPGAYPAVVLGLSFIVSLALLVRTLRLRETRVYTPFLSGSPLDVRLKRLCTAAAAILGHPVRLVSRTGAGRFSAFARGMAAGDDPNVVTVVTSEQAEIPNLDAANFVRRHFVPLLRFDDDPDLLISRSDSEWPDAAALLTQGERLRLGINQAPNTPAPVAAWFGGPAGVDVEPVFEEDWQILVELLRRREIDVAVVPFRVSGEPGFGNDLNRLGVFSEEPLHGVPPIPPANGVALLSGRWSGLAVNKAVDEKQRLALEEAFSEAAQKTMGGPEGLGFLRATPFASSLERRDEIRTAIQGSAEQPKLAEDKRFGLLAAIVATFAFPSVMEILGFPLTAFLFLSGLMSLLWPRFEFRALVRLVPLAAIIALCVHALFGGLFNVVFPEGSLTGF